MKVLSAHECREWLSANLARGLSLETLEAAYPSYAVYRLPVDTGAKTAIAHILTHSMDTSRGGLLWITAWGVFPSCENMALFDAYRKSFGESRDLPAAPGHLFGQSDLQHVECLLAMALYFYWDATVYEGAGTLVVTISHDECISVRADNQARLTQFRSNLGRLKLTTVGAGNKTRTAGSP